MCFGSNPSCYFLLVPSHATRSRRSTGALSDRANDAFVDQEHTRLYERHSSETIGVSVTVHKKVVVAHDAKTPPMQGNRGRILRAVGAHQDFTNGANQRRADDKKIASQAGNQFDNRGTHRARRHQPWTKRAHQSTNDTNRQSPHQPMFRRLSVLVRLKAFANLCLATAALCDHILSAPLAT